MKDITPISRRRVFSTYSTSALKAALRRKHLAVRTNNYLYAELLRRRHAR